MMQNKKLPTVEWSKKLDIQGGTQPPRSQFIDTPEEGYIRLIQIRDFESEKYVTYVPKTSKLKTCNKEDLFIARYGASIGRILRGLEGAYNVALAKVILKDDTFNKDFLYYFLQSNLFQNHIHRISSRSAQSGFNKNDLASIPVPNPFIKEQQKIAAILSSVDEAIEKTEEIIEQTEKVKKGLMQELFFKGVNNKDIKNTILGDIPRHWDIVQTGDLFENKSIKRQEHLEVLTVTQEQGVVFRKDFDMNIKFNQNSLPNYKKVDPGDFIISLRSFQGGLELSTYEGIVSPAYTVLQHKQNIDVEYFKYFLKSFWFIEQLKASTIGIRDGKQISYQDFKLIKIPLPPLEEQEEIVKILQSVEKRIVAAEKDVQSLNKIKQGLMQELLTGKKRVKVDDSEEVLS